MKGYAETDVFGAWELERLNFVTRLIEWLRPDHLDLGSEPLRCHELTRAVAHIMRRDLPGDAAIYVHDGQYGMVDHSWMWLRPPANPDGSLRHHGLVTSILDVYAVARLPQVQLVNAHVLGTRKINDVSYRTGPDRTDIDDRVVNRLIYDMMGFDETPW